MSQTVQDRRERQKEEQRRELINAAHQLIREEGYEGLTIRKLANRAGYATMSVYSYFADKHAILVALAEDQFEILAKRLRKDVTADPIDALRHGLLDFVDFGLENPNEYRTVFMTTEIIKDATEFDGIETRNPALQCLMERVDQAIAAGHFRGDSFAISTMLWTVAHGAISLFIAMPFYPFGDREAYAARLFDAAMKGIAADDVPPLTPKTTLS
jgi:AcrR family transcriptional regulator